MGEASAADTPYGRYITSEGWFVVNLGDTLAVHNSEKGGTSYPIESEEHPFADFGVHLKVIEPGVPSALYHSEGAQEGFLVLSGECTLLVEEQQRALRRWDYFHCPAGTAHVFVGAGATPCALLMIGSRPDQPIHYPRSEVAARHDASVPRATSDPEAAYADWPGEWQPTRRPWPPPDSPVPPDALG